ncbi:MAG: 5'-nucleotidase C-terminal domain-containing protein [Adhaeribacter sp.]
MRFFRPRHIIYSIWFSLILISCQPALVPAAQLPPETDIKVDASVPVNAEMETLIAPYRQKLASQMNEVLGYSAQELRKVNNGESALGNFVADVQMAQVLPIYQKPIDLSLMTTGGLRATIPKGPVTLSNIFELSPFENELVVLTLPGTTLQKLFVHGAQSKNLVLKNASFTIKNDKPLNIKVNGKPLDSTKSYTMVVSDYLANGGDELFLLKEATKVEPTGILVRDALIKHIRQLTAQNKPIEARLDGRIKIL